MKSQSWLPGWFHRGLITACLALTASTAFAASPVLVTVVSRMTHGSGGPVFDVVLPQTSPYAVECRSNGGAMQLVLTFDQAITSGTATLNAGVATLTGNPVFSGSSVTLNLTAVANAQLVTLNLNNITGAGGTTVLTPISFRTLLGDVNGSGLVTGTDVTQIKFAVNTPLTGANFRCDLNVSGTITGTDVTSAKFATNSTVAGGMTPNTPPTITTVAAQTAVSGQASSPVGFTIGDAESPVATLAVSASSDNAALLPSANIALSGTGASRTVIVTPAAGQTGSCNVTLMVSDGLATTSSTFAVTVTPAPTVYLASLQPVANTGSLASGTATLTVSGDQTYAIVKWTYSNLSGSLTDDQVQGPGNSTLYDMPVGRTRGDLQADGTLKWTFGANAASYLATIQAGNASLLVDTATHSNGELVGTFTKVVGSQSFTAPVDPTPNGFTINPPSANDASRFLQQAAFGGTSAEIAALSNPGAANANTAINDWLANQFGMQMPISPDYSASGSPVAGTFSSASMYQWIYNRTTTAQAPNAYGDGYQDDRLHEAWWRNAVTAPDQLRQRIATALSEIFVISQIDTLVDDNELGVATYYDMLGDDAFGNFRQILYDVTLHPAMGEYLNMMANEWINASTSPNENYAREVLQLFSIGLYMLQLDGTLVLDQNGQPIPTYDQPTITQFAHVFTGWNQNGTDVVVPLLVRSGTNGAVVQKLDTFWQMPMVLAPSNGAYHSQVAKQLLVYPGAATFPGAGKPAFIPANASQTSNSANAELNFAIDNIFNHPNVGPFICRQLIQRLVSSNPSPGYVYRVAQKFNNNGQGVRGDMKAVITAIFTDYEARSATLVGDPGYGRMREPIVRIANVLRSLNAVSKTNKWMLGKTDDTLSQTIFRSPTVFNYFTPGFGQPGPIQQAGLVSPEFEIIVETTIINAQNILYTGIYANYNADGSPTLTGTGFRGDSEGSDIYLDFSPAGNNLMAIMQGTASSQLGTTGVSGVLDQLNIVLMSGQMDPAVKTRLTTFINTLNATDYIGRVKAATHLVATAAQFSAQK